MDSEFYIDLGLTVLFRLLKSIPKKPDQKRQWRNAFLKLRNKINEAYSDDSDFGGKE